MNYTITITDNSNGAALDTRITVDDNTDYDDVAQAIEDAVNVSEQTKSYNAARRATGGNRLFVTKGVESGTRYVREGVDVRNSRVVATAGSKEDAFRIKNALAGTARA